MTKEETRLYNKQYREANKKRIAASKKSWNEANRDKIKAHRDKNRDAINATKREWSKNNKELVAAMDKRYREANKEKLSAKSKKYREANKEAISEKKKLEYANNREEVIARSIKFAESKKDGYYTVYYLPEEHYVGQTNSLYLRLKGHKCESSRHVLDAEVLAKFETRKEALAFEAKLHDMGYHGKNNGQ